MTNPRLGIAYFGNRYPGHANSDLREITSAGASFVVHTMSESDLRWNSGTMQRLVSMSKQLGLETWLTPWALGGVFGGESPSYAVMEFPSSCQRDCDGNHLPALCPSSNEYRRLVLQWLDTAATIGADVVVWDEPHMAFPQPLNPLGHWACRCGGCQERFSKQYDHPMPQEWDYQVAEFLATTLNQTLKWNISMATERGLQSAVILLPDEATDIAVWREITAMPGVRYFGLTPYWIFQGVPAEQFTEYLNRWCERILAATSHSPVEPMAWIQAFSIPRGRESEIIRGMEIMMENGITTIGVWAFHACEAMSALTPDDPGLVWETVLQGFRHAGNDCANHGS